jgi:hypothetical protein
MPDGAYTDPNEDGALTDTPYDGALTETGSFIRYVYVADSGNWRIKKHLESDFSFISQFDYATYPDDIDYPTGLTADGWSIYWADPFIDKIEKRTSDFYAFEYKIEGSGTGNDQWDYPVDICFDGTHVYICDGENHRIVKRLADDLTYVNKIGSFGTGNDQFNFPAAADVDETHIYIADSINSRVVKRLTSDLSYVTKVSTPYEPNGIAIDLNYVYVSFLQTTPTFETIVRKLNKSDLSFVSDTSLGNQYESFYGRVGLCVHGNYLYVVGNNKLEKRDSSTFAVLNSIGGTQGSGELQFNNPEGVFVVDEIGINDITSFATLIW